MDLTQCTKRALGWAKNESKFIYGVAEHRGGVRASHQAATGLIFSISQKNYLGKDNSMLQRFNGGPA